LQIALSLIIFFKSFIYNPAVKALHTVIWRETMTEMEFYDVKSKKKFKTSTFIVKEKNGRYFAVAKSPTGTHECWRVMSKDQAMKVKK